VRTLERDWLPLRKYYERDRGYFKEIGGNFERMGKSGIFDVMSNMTCREILHDGCTIVTLFYLNFNDIISGFYG